MFLNTLKALYYDRMIGNSNKDFFDVVSAGEMIEARVKQGKIETSKAKKPTPKRKEGKTSGKKTSPQNIMQKVEKIQLLGSHVLHPKMISQKSKLLLSESLGEDIKNLLGTWIVL